MKHNRPGQSFNHSSSARNAMRCLISAVAVTSLGAPACYGADYEPCVQHPQLVGSCWHVRGRVALYNGNPSVRIWPVGSKRILGVREAEPPLVPPELAAQLTWNTNVYSDLKLCPLTKQRSGAMQIVCVAGADNVVTRAR